MGGSADPEAPTPSPSPSPVKAKAPSPSSADAKRLRRCVQSKLLWRAAEEEEGQGLSLPLPRLRRPRRKEGGEEPKKRKKRLRPRKSEAARKIYFEALGMHAVTTGRKGHVGPCGQSLSSRQAST